MPIYDYKCACCLREEELIRKVEERQQPYPCKECNGPMEPQVTVPGGFVFKGEGTYDKGFVGKE